MTTASIGEAAAIIFDQQEWFDLKEKLGEAAARQFIIDKLRWAADQIEKGGFPDIFGFRYEEVQPLPLTIINLTLSDVWPG